MNIIPTEGLSKDQVFAQRGYGASDAVIICGHGYKGSSRLKLWYSKRGDPADDDFDERTSKLLWWGNELEPVIAKRFTLDTGLKFKAHQVLVRHPKVPWATCLIDGLTETDEIVDFKAQTFFVGCELDDGDPSTLPAKAHIQAAWQMYVTDTLHARWACYSDLDLKHFIIDRDEDLVTTVFQLVSEFREHVELGTTPDEFDPADNAYLKRRFNRVNEQILTLDQPHLIDVASRYLQAKEAERYAKEEQDRLQAELRMAVGEASTALVGPYKISRKTVERRGYPVEPTSYVDFRVTEPKGRK
jgi:predicted phage-related endonuclease